MNAPMKFPELIGDSPLTHARVTGLVGLVVVTSGSFAGFVASRLIVRDAASQSELLVARAVCPR